MATSIQNYEEPKKENFVSLLQGIFEGHNFSYQTDNQGNIFFLAKDICEILQLSDVSKAISRLDEDEKGTTTIPTLGGNQEVLTINEVGLYSLIGTSRKAAAKRFKKYVNSIILPQIRATGNYNSAQLTTKEILQIALKAEEEREKLLQLNTHQNDIIDKQNNLLEFKDQVIEELKPASEFMEKIFKPSQVCRKVGEFAKTVCLKYPDGKIIGPNEMFKLLRAMGYLMWGNIPQEKYIKAGYFELKENISQETNIAFSPTTLITTKGQEYLYKKLKAYLGV